MSMGRFSLLLICVCLAAWILPDFAEARRGGGGFRGGGGGRNFSRGGGGSFGSIRNSPRPSQGMTRPSQGYNRPSQGYNRPSQGQLPERLPSQRPTQRDNGRLSREQQQVKDFKANMSPEQQQRIKDFESGRSTEQKQQLKDKAAKMTPEQKQAAKDRAADRSPEQRQQMRDRMADLTPEQKDQLREKFEDAGLKPEDLPDRDEIREDWQDWYDQNREDWQDWYEDRYDDYWDDRWYSSWWYGYPVSRVSYSFYIYDQKPCQETIVINQARGSTTYYYCDSVWYQQAYTSGSVKYVVTSPPAGAELKTLSNPRQVTVNGQDYYVSNHVFYQKIVRNGKTLYTTVDAPIGAVVQTIPEYAVMVEADGQTYYRFDNIFYVRKQGGFVVVSNPGV
jgi:hypothetical protein